MTGESLDLWTADRLQPMAEAAKALSATLCTAPHGNGRSCRDYHGYRLYARLLGLSAAASGHAPFLLSALREQARRGACRMLVAGAADHISAALVVDAFQREGVTPEVTVLDLCPTPVALSILYGRSSGVPVTGVAADILGFQSAAPFDLIYTHLILGWFVPADRERLVRRWHALLAPGGAVVTVNVLRPGGGVPREPTPERLARVLDRTRAAAAARPELQLSEEEMLRIARQHAAGKLVHPLRTAAEAQQLFEGAGFRLDRMTVRPTGGRLDDRPRSEGAEDIEIVATRL